MANTPNLNMEPLDSSTKQKVFPALYNANQTKIDDFAGATNAAIAKFKSPDTFSTKAALDSALWQVTSSSASTNYICYIVNSAKDDAFTSMANLTHGVLIIYENNNIWSNHPSFVFIAGNGVIYNGTAEVTSEGTTINSFKSLAANSEVVKGTRGDSNRAIGYMTASTTASGNKRIFFYDSDNTYIGFVTYE